MHVAPRSFTLCCQQANKRQKKSYSKRTKKKIKKWKKKLRFICFEIQGSFILTPCVPSTYFHTKSNFSIFGSDVVVFYPILFFILFDIQCAFQLFVRCAKFKWLLALFFWLRFGSNVICLSVCVCLCCVFWGNLIYHRYIQTT